MPVAPEVREKVKNRLDGACYFFHNGPVPGTQYVHLEHHQGIGGLPPEHEYNQEENGAWGCDECHQLFHIPEEAEEARHAGTVFKVEEFQLTADPFDRVMKIRDTNGKLIDTLETPIWYLIEPYWKEGREKRVELEDAVRQLFTGMFRVAQGFEYFRDFNAKDLKRPWKRFMAFNDRAGGVELTKWEDLPPILNFTVREANRYERQARWATESNSVELVRGMAIYAIDALRKIKDEARLVEIAGIAQHGKPQEFWAAIDAEVTKHESMCTFELVSGEIRIVRGQMKDGTLVDVDGKPIEIRPGEKVIKRGVLIRGTEGVTEEEDKLEEEEDGYTEAKEQPIYTHEEEGQHERIGDSAAEGQAGAE